MSPAEQNFQEALNLALVPSVSGIGTNTAKLGTFGLGQRFMDIIKKVFVSIDVSSLTKEEFLAVVSRSFDTFIAPMLASNPMGILIVPIVKALVMTLATKFYDNHKKVV